MQEKDMETLMAAEMYKWLCRASLTHWFVVKNYTLTGEKETDTMGRVQCYLSHSLPRFQTAYRNSDNWKPGQQVPDWIEGWIFHEIFRLRVQHDKTLQGLMPDLTSGYMFFYVSGTLQSWQTDLMRVFRMQLSNNKMKYWCKLVDYSAPVRPKQQTWSAEKRRAKIPVVAYRAPVRV